MTLPDGQADQLPSVPSPGSAPANLADILERILDKGIVIAGDIRIDLLDIELLTVKLRLLVASVDKAREMGINWWESDRSLTRGPGDDARSLEERIARLEAATGVDAARDEDARPPAERDAGERR